MFGEMTSGFFLAKIARNDISGASEEEKKEHIQSLSEKIGKLQLVVIGLIICGFVSVGLEFMGLWLYNVQFTSDIETIASADAQRIIYYCIIIICSYEIIHIPQLALQNEMFTNNHIKPMAIIAVIKAVINLSMSFVMSHFYGAIGAAISIGVANIIELVIANIAYKKYLKISLLHYFKSIYFKGGITLIVTLAIGLSLHFFLPLNDRIPIKFLVDGVIVVIVYLQIGRAHV